MEIYDFLSFIKTSKTLVSMGRYPMFLNNFLDSLFEIEIKNRCEKKNSENEE